MMHSGTKLSGWVGSGLAVALLAGASPATAQVVSYSGYTNGCFGACTPSGTDVFESMVNGGLTFENSTFSGSTLAGFAGIGDDPNAAGARDLDNLGAFYLNSTTLAYGGPFNLVVSFLTPGWASQTFTGTLSGSVAPGAGGVYIDFDNTPQTFNYSNSSGSGTITLSLNDVTVQAPEDGGVRAVPVTGNLQASAPTVTPEPMSVLLLGTGLFGIAGVATRRRKQTQA